MRIMKRLLSITLAAAMLGTVLLPSTFAAQTEETNVNTLTVNYRAHPLGIDTTPVFGWKLSLEGFNRAQSAYRITVADTAENAAAQNGTVWDSGKQNGENNYDIAYAGEALKSQTAYYWTVEAWDENGASVGVSAPACFETGLIDEADWTGKFIQAPKASAVSMNLSGAKWIWRRNGANFNAVPAGNQYFRKHFTVSKALAKAELVFTADDESTFYVNGRAVGSTSAWGTAAGIEISAQLLQGENVLAMQALNTTNGYAGALCKLILTYTDNTTETIVSDTGWRVAGTVSGDWYATDFDDSAWSAPDQAESFGNAPWGTNVSIEKPGERTAPIFRKTFTVDKAVVRARAYVSGLGLYDFDINGADADDTVLNPAHTDYNQTVLYNVYDLTDKIVQGENAVGVMVGHGFFDSIMDGWNWSQADWRDRPMLRMELLLDYADGTTDKIVTDESWLYTLDGPITADDIYYGETYDARRALDGYSTASFDDSGWGKAALATAPKGKMTYEDMEPMRRVAAYEVEVTRLSDGTHIVKAPVVMSGWLNIKFNEPKDTQITVTYGEKLDNAGKLILKTESKGATQRDTYICNGTASEVYEPRFSYKGYQYVQIDGLVNGIAAADVVAYQINNDLQIDGSIETSSAMINGLHEMAVRTMLNNFQGKPTDTPYLEKNGWLGDANVALEMFNYNFGMPSFMQKFIGDLSDAQQADGDIPALVPIYNWGPTNVPVWNTIFIHATKELENTYGSVHLTEQQYDKMRKLALKEISQSKARGWTWYDDQLADWVSPMGGTASAAYNENPVEGSGICGTAYVYQALKYMAEFADRLGKTADAAEYRDAMASIYTAFNKKYYKAADGIYDTGYWNSSYAYRRTKYRQTSNIVPLVFGLVPEENKATVLQNLVKDIVEKGYHLDTGVVGTKYILPVLADNGYADVAYKILAQETYPSWGYWYSKGATTTHEMWEDTSRSLNHYFLGTYDEYLYKGIGGIRDMTDGYKTVTIQPRLEGDLSFANVSVKTVRGTLQNNWTKHSDGSARLALKIPIGTAAKVYVPTTDAANVKVNGAAVAVGTNGVTASATEGSDLVLTLGSGDYTVDFNAYTASHLLDADGVSLEQTALTLTVGETATLNPIITPATAMNRKVTWKSSNTLVASVTSSGKITAKNPGTATVTVTTKDGGFTATCEVTVKEAPIVLPDPPVVTPPQTIAVQSIKLNLTKKTVVLGKSVKLTATVSPSNATNKTVTWTTSNKKVATVSGGTVKTVGTGTAKITASAGGKKAIFKVTVTPAQVKNVKATGKKGKAVINFKMVKGAAKYQVVFTKDKKTVKKWVKKSGKAVKLKKGAYKVKVRAYGGKQYGKYSKIVRVKVK